jgi:membrane protease subunit (stomatin/prohibitin family)
MGIWDKLRGELIDIIEWLDETRDTMVWRYPRGDNEIKYGAKLIVREGQAAAFVNEGQLADVFKPGTYTLATQNLPILSKLKGWKYGFESPFKAEVYFVSTRTFTDRKWGTKNPIMLRDAEFGPVRLRAFGTFAFCVGDPAAFLRQVVGTNGRFTADGIDDQLRDLLTARFGDVLGESKIPILDLASNYDELGKFVTTRIQSDFDTFGLHIVNLLVENISLPAEVEAALDKRSSMGIIGNLSAYTQYQTANAMEAAAKNPGGSAGGGLGLGAGFAMGQQMANQMGGGASPGAANAQHAQSMPAAPPPLPQETQYFVAVDGKQTGPFDLSALREKASAGQLTRRTLVWKSGLTEWKPAEAVAELGPVFAEVPPPLPKNG